jgi:YHS domain-containing protein
MHDLQAERSMLIRFSRLIAIAAFALFSTGALAGDFFETDGVALRGYDPVAYFVSSEPQKGQSQYSYEYRGSKFYFASEANQRAFMQMPEKYAPQFGGYCAYGTAQGYKVSTQPDAFAIVQDKLYLNYDRKVQKIWQQDVPGNIQRAQKNWPEVSKSARKD